MRIKELEVSGFKSFVDRIKLNFKPGITALVGPNGCGKSNVIDAMRWIMGEHNARHLRGAKMEDLIFNGSESRKPTGMAEVSMILSNGNGESLLGNATEIMVTRRLFRSGESEYYINKTPCRLKDIIEMFLDSGVGTKSYSVMEQGKIDFILSLKPDERRILVEEAAGIAKYRSRKKEAHSKMMSTKNNLLRLKDILNELQVQMRGLDLQVKRLKRHKNIREEIKSIDLIMASFRHQSLKCSNDLYQAELSKLRDEEIQLSAQKNTTEANLEETRFNLTEIHKLIDQLSQECYVAKESIQKEESSIQLNEQELKNSYDFIEKNGKALQDLEDELNNVKNEIAAKEKELSMIESDVESIMNSVNSASENHSISKNRLLDLYDKIEKGKAELFNAAHEITEIKNAMTLNKRLQDEIELKIQKVKSEKENCHRKLQELEDNKGLLERGINENTVVKEQKKLTINELEELIANLTLTLNNNDLLLNDLKDKIGRVSARLETLNELQKNLEGYDTGVRTIINNENGEISNLKGIIGLFADIIETDPEYELVLEAVLDKVLQSILVETHQDGFNAIEQLKIKNGGRVTFVPLTLQCDETNEYEIYNAVPLISLIKTNHDFDNLIKTLLKDVLLVDNFTNALEIWSHNRSKYTIVTRDGEIIDSKGIISGGSANAADRGILKRNREIKEFTDSLKQLESQLLVLKSKKEETSEALNKNKQLFEVLVKEIQTIDNLLFQQKTNIDQTIKLLQQEKEKSDLLSFEESDNIESLNKFHIEFEDLLKKEAFHREIEDKKRSALNELQENEKVLKEELERAEQTHTDYRVNLASAQQRHENILGNLNRLLETNKATHDKIVSLKQELDAVQNKTETLSLDIDASKNNLTKLIDKSRNLESQTDNERRKAHAIESSVKSSDNSLKELRSLWEEIEPKIHEIDLKLNEVSIHQEHLKKNILEKYFITGDQLPPPQSPDSYNEEEYKERLETLQKRIENIGEVNLGASKEYEDIEKRFQFLSSQEEDLLQSINSLQKVITKINSITRQKFFDTFNEINKHFQELFPLLFNGGKAYMELTDETDLLETGIEVFARPPGKKLQSLDLLSGGERALTVIALMFSIFLTKPSPFCLMDEIDAPLDDSNLERFIKHLHKMSERSQFIIVTHNKISMQAANSLYGITMEERGVSKVVSVELN